MGEPCQAFFWGHRPFGSECSLRGPNCPGLSGATDSVMGAHVLLCPIWRGPEMGHLVESFEKAQSRLSVERPAAVVTMFSSFGR